MFFIINDTEESLTIQARDEAINGFMISGTMSCDVLPGKMAIDSLSFFSRQLEENGIDGIPDIELIEFDLNIFESNDWGGGFQTGLIEITP